MTKTMLLIFCLISSLATAQHSADKMWVKLETASQTANFYINIPENGCVSLSTISQGKKSNDIIWGPRLMNKGLFKLPIPASAIIGKKGIVELFTVELTAAKETGSRGNGERQFNSPMGIDYDRTRNELLVADTGNDRIIRLTQDGRYLGKHGGFGVSFGDKSEEREDSLDTPYDVAAGGFSNFYVSDQNNKRICVFDSYRTYKGKFYPTDTQRRNSLNRPKGIKVDYENNIWIVDGRSDKIIKIAPNGDKLLELGGFGRGKQQLRSPNQIDVGPSGEIFVADTGKSRIVVFDRFGSFLREITNIFKQPTAVAIDPDGLLVVCDASKKDISLITPLGVLLSNLSTDSTGSKLKNPADLTCNSDYIFCVDSGNHSLLHIKRKKLTTIVSWQCADSVIE
ncbi:MAG: NHL repeat-containing protein [Candidatus Ozemobacteraceae bacterium]